MAKKGLSPDQFHLHVISGSGAGYDSLGALDYWIAKGNIQAHNK
ncbi:hypothetical protein ACFLWZ_04620 [Chloroflexota bacterium]